MAKGKGKHPRPSVLLLFLGGSVIDSRGRRGDLVRKPKDIEPWLAQMSEMDIIADTTGHFIGPGTGAIGLAEWAGVAKAIEAHYAGYDGFVVVHQLETIEAAAEALSLMLDGLEKPVVLVGSWLHTRQERSLGRTLVVPGAQEFGAKASFINAVQVAVSDAAEVLVVFGSTIFRGHGLHSTADPQPTLTGRVLGKIDFGIRLFGAQIKRAKRAFRIRAQYETNVAMVEYVPGLTVEQVVGQATGRKGLFFSLAPALQGGAAMLPSLASSLRGLPIAVFGLTGRVGRLPSSLLVLADQTRTAALIHFLWALGQAANQSALRKLLLAPTDR
ncbi:MAG: asparaginase [Candidatus Kerfeldbacteria bacterium]|nr:asparaginase [Candidatus Kerfeldbacteria bacterium]